MTYLVSQIWFFILAGSGIGFFMGWLFNLAAGAGRVRELRQRVADIQAEAAQQREEAARLAVQVQGRGPAADPRIGAVLDLELKLRESRLAAERAAAEAARLRARIAELEEASQDERPSPAKPAAISAGRSLVVAPPPEPKPAGPLAPPAPPPAILVMSDEEAEEERQRMAEELVRFKARARDAETAAQEVLRLRARLAERPEGAGLSAGEVEALRRRIVELEAAAKPEGDDAETEGLRRRVAELEDALQAAPSAPAEPAVEALRARVAELEEVENAEIARLRDRIAELEAQPASGGAAELRAEGGAEGDEEPAGDLPRLKWRNRYLASRVRYLESKLSEAEEGDRVELRALRARVGDLESTLAAFESGGGLQDEVERLRGRIKELEGAKAAAAEHGPGGEDGAPSGDGYALEWRNRYLGSRVRYLERRLQEMEAPGASVGERRDAEIEELRGRVAGLQVKADESDRLRARLAELEAGGPDEAGRLRGRVAELERQLDELRQQPPRSGEEPRKSGDYELEWRVRYLTSRVRYLEERLNEASRRAAEPTGDSQNA